MYDVFEKEAFEGLLPNIYIEKIKIENSSSVEKKTSPRKTFRKNIVSEKKPLKISLVLNIKQKLVEETKQKKQEIDFKKYFRIKILELRDAKLTSLVSLTKDVVVALDPKTFGKAKPSVIRLLQGHLKREKNNILRFITENVDVKSIDISMMEKAIGSSTSIETLNNGEKIKNTRTNVVFDGADTGIGHISYCCIAELDYDAIVKDFKIGSPTQFIEHIKNISNITAEIAIDNFQTKKEATVYTDKNSKIWTGPVGKDSNGKLVARGSRAAAPKDLVQTTIKNPVIHDSRKSEKLKEINFEKNPKKLPFAKQSLRQKSPTLFNPKKSAFFSEFTIATDETGVAKFEFSLDLRKAIVENSEFSSLIPNENSSLINNIAKNTKIQTIKMDKQRVKETIANQNDLVSGTKYVPFDSKSSKKILFDARYNDDKIVENRDSSFRKKKNVNSDFIYEFTGVDKEISKMSEGLYSYSVEIKIQDPIVCYFQKLISVLRQTSTSMKSYLNTCTKPPADKYFEDNRNPQLQSPKSKSKSRSSSTKGSYDQKAEMFTESFKKEIMQQYSDLTESPWIIGSIVYTEILSYFNNNLDKEKELSETLKKCNPHTGSIDGISELIEMIEKLINNIESIIGKNNLPDRGQLGTTKGKSSSTILIKQEFDKQVFDCKKKNQPMLDYLQIEKKSNDKTGLSTVSGQQFLDRVAREEKRYGLDQTLSTVQQTDFKRNRMSFLTPGSLKHGKEKNIPLDNIGKDSVTEINNFVANKKTKNVFNEKPKDKNDKKLEHVSAKNRKLQQENNIVFSKESFAPVTSGEKYVRKNLEISLTEEPDPKKISRESSNVLSGASREAQISSVIETCFKSTSFPKKSSRVNKADAERGQRRSEYPNQYYAAKDQSGAIGNIELNKAKLQVETSLPGAVAGTLCDRQDLGSNRIAETLKNENLTTVTLGNTKKILVKVGYDIGENGQTLIKQPKWETLTEDLYNQFPFETELTCKFAEFDSKELKEEDMKDVPIVDETFILIVDRKNETSAFKQIPKYMLNIAKPRSQIKKSNSTDSNLSLLAAQEETDTSFEIPKAMLDVAVKQYYQHKTFPPALTKTLEVQAKTIEQVVSDTKVREKVKQKQNNLRSVTNKRKPKLKP